MYDDDITTVNRRPIIQSFYFVSIEFSIAKYSVEDRRNMASVGMVGMGMGIRMGMGASQDVGVKSRRTSFATMATGKKMGGSVEEKGPFDWILSGMQKDQLVETDPILKKMDDDTKSGGTTSRKVAAANDDNDKKKFPGFGGLFSKN